MKKYFFFLAVLILPLCVLGALNIETNIIGKAKKYLGTPYVYGGDTPSGFDCSGFVFFVYKDVIPGMSRVTTVLAEAGEPVSRNNLKPGDLLFWATGSDPKDVSHVSIYIGNNKVIHALSEGPRRGIAISDINSSYWKNKFLFARRVIPAALADAGNSAGTEDGKPATAAAGEQVSGEVLVTVLGRYAGETKNGQPHGTGRYMLNNGDVYVGSMKDGRFNGPGTYTSAKGTVWKGVFKNGVLSGKAVREWAGGERYEGEYRNGLESGGWYTDKNGGVFWVYRNSDGDWIVDRQKSGEASADNNTARRNDAAAGGSAPSFSDFADSQQAEFDKFKKRKN